MEELFILIFKINESFLTLVSFITTADQNFAKQLNNKYINKSTYLQAKLLNRDAIIIK